MKRLSTMFTVTHSVQLSLHYTEPVYHWHEAHLDVRLSTAVESLEYLQTTHHELIICTINFLRLTYFTPHCANLGSNTIWYVNITCTHQLTSSHHSLMHNKGDLETKRISTKAMINQQELPSAYLFPKAGQTCPHYYRVWQKMQKYISKNHTLKFVMMPWPARVGTRKLVRWVYNYISSSEQWVDFKMTVLHWFRCTQTYHHRPLFSTMCTVLSTFNVT